ncbi:MAG: type II toxin-antitoxin system RelE/ParE family toxin [bacterium]
MKIILSPLANQDLDEIESYIFKDNPAAAVDVILRILDKIQNVIRLNPSIGRKGRILGSREFVMPDLPYIIPYRVKDDVLEVIRVIHTSVQLS